MASLADACRDPRNADYDGRKACNNCSACQSGCPTGAMFDVSMTADAEGLARAGAQLIANARVETIETGDQTAAPPGRSTSTA